MGKQWPHEKVSEAGALLPETMLTVKVVKGEEGETRNGKYSIGIRTRVVEPKSVRNQPYRFQFVIGTEDDMEADEADTWTGSFAASRYKSFLKAADVPETGDVEEELESVAGSILRIENAHSEDGKYNEARAFYRNGDDESEAEETAPAKKTAKKAVKKAKPAPVEEDDEDSDETEEDEDFE